MKILDDLISSLKGDDAPVTSVHTCVFWTAVTSKYCGLASTFRDEERSHERGVRDVGRLTQKTGLELAEYARSDNRLEASLGMAAINSLIDIDESRCVERNALEIILQKGASKDVTIVGHFPWVPKLRENVRHLWVLEQRPRPGDLPSIEADHILPRSDVVGITGTSFINHSLEDLLKLCRNSFVLLIGPTAPLSSVLFTYGIDAICGTKVSDSKQVIQSITQGATFRQVKGVRLLTLMR